MIDWPWLVSDEHFGHKNIMLYENRPFRDVEEMENELIKRHNSVVKKNDKVFMLGDFSFYPKEQSQHIKEQLNGNIHLIKGNHDNHSNSWYRDIGFQEVSKYPIIVWGNVILSHEPVYCNPRMPFVNVHGHTHSICLNSKKHFNASVDNTNFQPIGLNEILNVLDVGTDQFLVEDE